jgi:squalene-hopene/tetraprenyl-beta-curcumene cyclase
MKDGSLTEGSLLQEAIVQARRFLEGSQLPNGRWLDFRGDNFISSHWVTAYVGSYLGLAGGERVVLDKARAWLLGHQHRGGGWGFSLANPPDADSIANAIHVLVQERGTEASEAVITEATRLLFQFWEESKGGFRTYCPDRTDEFHHEGSAWCDVHMSVTAMAAQVLYLVDRERHRAVLEACADFIRALQAPAGFWEDYWWDGRTYSTYHAARLLFLMGDLDPIKRAGDFFVQVRGTDGGWGNCTGGAAAPFHTALAVGTLLLDDEHRHSGAARMGISWLLRAQQPDGSWPAVPIQRIPYPHVHEPWKDPDGGHRIPMLVDRNRLFTTATVLGVLAHLRDTPR